MTTLNPFVLLGSVLRSVLPAPAVAWLQALVEALDRLLQSSPARVIGYGAAVVVYLVALAFGRIPDMTFEEAVVNATAAITILVGIIEAIRKYVFSPATVAAIVTTPPTAAGPIAAAEAVGVDVGG